MSFSEDDTSSPEHERYAAFTSRLAALESLPNALSNHSSREAAADPDVTMAVRFSSSSQNHRLLSEAQRGSLLSHPHYQQPFYSIASGAPHCSCSFARRLLPTNSSHSALPSLTPRFTGRFCHIRPSGVRISQRFATKEQPRHPKQRGPASPDPCSFIGRA